MEVEGSFTCHVNSRTHGCLHPYVLCAASLDAAVAAAAKVLSAATKPVLLGGPRLRANGRQEAFKTLAEAFQVGLSSVVCTDARSCDQRLSLAFNSNCGGPYDRRPLMMIITDGRFFL